MLFTLRFLFALKFCTGNMLEKYLTQL